MLYGFNNNAAQKSTVRSETGGGSPVRSPRQYIVNAPEFAEMSDDSDDYEDDSTTDNSGGKSNNVHRVNGGGIRPLSRKELLAKSIEYVST